MAEFNVRSDSVNVEHIMEQIRARIREKRGVDYTEAEIQELATARLEKYLDPQNVRADLLQEFHRVRAASDAPAPSEDVIDDSVLFETHRPWLRALRKVLRPILKLVLNTKALAALSLRAKAEVSRRGRDQLTFELLHNMVVEMTRLSIEVKNLTMRVESMQSRLEFNERRSRALEGVVVYKPADPEPVEQPRRPPPPAYESRPPAEFRPRHESPRHENPRHENPRHENPRHESPRQDAPAAAAAAPSDGAPAAAGSAPDGPGQRNRRRRRRRGRRGGGLGTAQAGSQPGQPGPAGESAPPQDENVHDSFAPDAGDSEPDPQ